MSIAPAISLALSCGESGGGQPSDSPLAQLRAAHDALTRFVERLVDCSRESQCAREIQPSEADRAAEKQLAELTARYAELQRALDEARCEAARRPKAAEPAGGEAASTDNRAEHEVLRNQLATVRASEDQLRTSLTQLQFERRSLNAELQVLRYRSVELAEELSREKQHGLAERTIWNRELGQWRHLLETQLTRLSPAAPAPPEGRTFARQLPISPQAEAMLASILADFQMLEHHPGKEPQPRDGGTASAS